MSIARLTVLLEEVRSERENVVNPFFFFFGRLCSNRSQQLPILCISSTQRTELIVPDLRSRRMDPQLAITCSSVELTTAHSCCDVLHL